MQGNTKRRGKRAGRGESGEGMSAPAIGINAAKDKIAARATEYDSPTPPSISFYKPFNKMEQTQLTSSSHLVVILGPPQRTREGTALSCMTSVLMTE